MEGYNNCENKAREDNANKSAGSKGKSVIIRVVVGVSLSLFFLIIWYFGGAVQNILFSLASFLCTYEIVRTLKAKGIDGAYIIALLFALLFSPIFMLFGVEYMFLAMISCMVLTIFCRLLSEQKKTRDLLLNLGMYIYPLGFMMFIFAVSNLPADDTGSNIISRIAMLTLFAAPLFGDTLAYFFGMLFGKKKLCPHISPKKTVAGSVGGTFGGVLAGYLIYILQDNIAQIFDSAPTTIGLVPLLIVGLLCGLVGQVGDLFASCLKRYANIKDFGNLFPGHGGMLDRLDSVLMCAPFVYIIFSDLI